MLCEGYPLWLPLALVGWNRLRAYRWATGAALAAGVYSVAYHLVNLATFDAVTDMNPSTVPGIRSSIAWHCTGKPTAPPRPYRRSR